jgi:hypothetical protein
MLFLLGLGFMLAISPGPGARISQPDARSPALLPAWVGLPSSRTTTDRELPSSSPPGESCEADSEEEDEDLNARRIVTSSSVFGY